MHLPLLLLTLGVSQKKFGSNEFSALDATFLLEEEALKTELHRKWKEFKMTHGKAYDSLEEEIKRKKIFNSNVKMINDHNKLYDQGLETFYMGITQFTDLTNKEFIQKHLNHRPLNATVYDTVEESFVKRDKHRPLDIELKNWFTKDLPVKDQRDCNSCWAFSATAVLEYAYYLFNNKELVSLSEQELVDCDNKSLGCIGGISYFSFHWIQKNGINFENEYPYMAIKNPDCNTKSKNVGPSIIKSVGFTCADEHEMFEKMKEVGPIQVAVYSGFWQFFMGGYFTPKNCNDRMSNHAVVAVGAAKYEGKDVWVLRNSWGPNWGINGHAYVTMFENACNIAQQPSAFINH